MKGEKQSMETEKTLDGWIDEFYKEINPKKRQEIFISNYSEPKTEADKFREELWVARYGKRKPRNDAFVAHIMSLKYISESDSVDIGGKKKKLAYEIIHGLHIYEYEKNSEEKKEIIYRELKNVWHRYIAVSANGRGFTSVIFGMGQLSDESVAKKIADQISAIAYKAPHQLRMDKEFSIVQRAAADAFREIYPNREHFLTKL